MRLRRVRVGELLSLVGGACVVVSLFRPWYEGPSGTLDAWDTFGPGMALIIVAAIAAFALVLSAVTEHSPALPVAVAVWTVPLALIATIAALVRVLERPDHTTSVCAGAWFALAGAVLILLGAWQSLRDEHTSLYEPATPERSEIDAPRPPDA